MSRALLLFLSITLVGQAVLAQDIIRCIHGDKEISENQLKQIEKEENALFRFSNASLRLEEEKVYTIPVVVHIVYYDNTENFSDEQVKQQIGVLNKDFRKKNSDTSKTPVGFIPDAGDAHIEFVLAKRDPNGNATNGITRTKTTKTSFSYSTEEVKHTKDGGHDAWDPTSYLNIWVCDLTSSGSKVIGYVPYPLSVGSANDGVAVSYTAFGTSGNLNPKYTLGRTATHEIGHWLNLLHLWGDPISAGCTSDYVDDTPPQADGTSSSLDCPVYPYRTTNDNCNSDVRGRMYCNFLDYTRDGCMNMFSNGQAIRMTTYLTMFRPGILNSKAFFENDLTVTNIVYDTTRNCGRQTLPPAVRIQNNGLDTVKVFDLFVSINNTEVKMTWQGILPVGQDTILRVDNVTFQEGRNQIKAKVQMVSPQPDQDTSNNSKVYQFSCPLNRDLKVVGITYDATQDCDEGMNEVKVEIKNAGSERITQYQLNYYVNNTLVFNEEWQGSLLASEDTTWVIKSGPFLGGSNHLKAIAKLLDPSNDQNILNDSIQVQIDCVSPLSIYPNPASSFLYLEGNDPQVESVILYSVEGKEALHARYSQSIDISSLKQGLYVVTFVTKEERIRHQLIIVR